MPSGAPTTTPHTAKGHETTARPRATQRHRDLGAACTGSEARLRTHNTARGQHHRVKVRHRGAVPQGSTTRGGDTTMTATSMPLPRLRGRRPDAALHPATARPATAPPSATRTTATANAAGHRRYCRDASAQASGAAVPVKASGRVAGTAPGTASMPASRPDLPRTPSSPSPEPRPNTDPVPSSTPPSSAHLTVAARSNRDHHPHRRCRRRPPGDSACGSSA
jgi:hypothetical protein